MKSLNRSRKCFFVGIFSLFSAVLMAQNISKHAVGVSLGGGRGFFSDLSYQMKVSASNRFQFGLSFNDQANLDLLQLEITYQEVYNLPNNFQWYLGYGGYVGTYSNELKEKTNRGTFLGATGDIGIEYSLRNKEIPLQFALEYSPGLTILGNKDVLGLYGNWSFSIRYLID